VTCQGLAAALAGALAEFTQPGAAITGLAVGSLLVSLGLTPALNRAAAKAAVATSRESLPAPAA
jgi:hypothetical protein